MKRPVTFLPAVLLAVFLLAGPLRAARAQIAPAEVGLPLVGAYYPPEAYGAHPQNWDVVQDDRGLVYVANYDGVLVFDGTRWRTIPVDTTGGDPMVRVLAANAEGTVFVGMRGDFGYLAPDSVGRLRFVSLKGEIPADSQEVGHVWGVHATPGGVYFQTRYRLFRWDGEEMVAWPSGKFGFHTSFAVRGRVYVRDIDHGLMTVTGDSLHVAPGGERFADAKVRMMAPYPDGRILIATQEQGFFLYDGASTEPFPTQAEAFLKDAWLYAGCALPGGRYALATRGSGVFIMDRNGRVVRILDQAAELPDGVVNAVYAGRQSNLWMALNNAGVARVQMPSPISIYDSEGGLNGMIMSMQRHRGTLYVGTGAGLYHLNDRPLSAANRGERQRSTFEAVPNVPAIVYTLLSTEYGLLAGTDQALYLVHDGRAERIIEPTVYTLIHTEQHGGRILAGTKTGLAVLERAPGGTGWVLRAVPGIEEAVKSIYETNGGVLWMETGGGTVLRARFPEGAGLDAPPKVTRYDAGDGLPDEGLYVGGLFDEVVIAADEGLFQPVRTSGGGPADLRFVRDTSFALPSTVEAGTLESFASSGDDLWLGYVGWIVHVEGGDDGTITSRIPPALHFPKDLPLRLYTDDSGVLWIGSGNRLLRYDPTVPGIYNEHFPALVRKVVTLGKDSEVVFGGTRPPEAEGPREVPYSQNDLRFNFSMPAFNTVTPVEYQYRLAGLDAQWSDWGEAPAVAYTDLHEGSYRFMVRARTERGYVSEVAAYGFTLLAPWYRTWWAYTLYVTFFVLLLVGAGHYVLMYQRHKRAEIMAEAYIRERKAAEDMKTAHEELKRVNTLKDTFLSNLSHELRTPLTAILGFADIIRDETDNEEHREFLDIIKESGNRLLETLTSLLDVAQMRAGMAEVELEPVNVSEKVRVVVQRLESLAMRKELEVDTVLPESPVYASLDPAHLDRVLQNLIGNAIKFTDEGKVAITVRPLQEKVELQVVDTGVGIDDTFSPHVFEEFRQESTGLDRGYEGNGVGLAITSHLVDLMGGSIEVESTKGEGSRFTVHFPNRTEADHPAAAGRGGRVGSG